MPHQSIGRWFESLDVNDIALSEEALEVLEDWLAADRKKTPHGFAKECLNDATEMEIPVLPEKRSLVVVSFFAPLSPEP